jgi:hypothetical protein
MTERTLCTVESVHTLRSGNLERAEVGTEPVERRLTITNPHFQAMPPKGPSYIALVLATICLISIASFIFLSSPQKVFVGMKDHLLRGRTSPPHSLNELKEYVNVLEKAVKSESASKHLETKSSEDHVADHLATFQPPSFDAATSDRLQSTTGGTKANTTPKGLKETLDDTVTSQWLSALASKLLCIRLKSGGIYLYHTRKAAGTSIRDILTTIAATWHVPYYETEGIVLNREIIDKKNGLLTVTSLREPVARIMSLYWYEHVGWYDGVLKQTERCKSLKEWVNAWRDGSRWKTEFLAKNPDSVYVEIENYYVKMLTGWRARNAHSRVTVQDFEAAKSVLRLFDLVLLSDWMGDSTQIEALNAVFPGEDWSVC